MTVSIRLCLILLTLLLIVPRTLAQSDATITITEAEVNATYRVTNPRLATISNVYVDLQPGLVEISATYTTHRLGETYNFAAQFTPAITQNGTVAWTLVNFYATDGDEIPDAIQPVIESLIMRTWESYWSARTFRFDLTSVTVTDTEITYVYARTDEHPPVQPTVLVTEGMLQVSYTESELNEGYRVRNPRRATVSNVYVDLQPGQVSISATYTPRRADPIETVTVLVPEINNGALTWVVVGVSADGQIMDDTTAISQLIVNSWLTYWRGRFSGERLQGVSIGDDEITFSYQ